MFHHSSSRNHRSKGSNVKRILQLAVLLAVACWLIYQVKHSHQKKAEFAGNNEIKLSKKGEEIYLGRKGDAGSENVVIIDVNTQVSDDSTEAKQDEVRHDTAIPNNEDIPLETPHNDELLDSQEGEPEQHDHSHANEGGEHEDSKDFEKPEDVKTDSAVGEVEATMADEETTSSSANQTQSGKIAGEEIEEASRESGSQEVSTDDDAAKEKGVDSDEHNNSSSDISVDSSNVDDHDHAGDGARTEDAHINELTNDVDELHGGERVGSQTDASHEAGAAGVENVDANTEASKEGEIGTQVGSVSDIENTDNNSSGETKTESEKVSENSSTDTEQKNSSAESQTDKDSNEENSSEANANDDGTSQNNSSQESKNETENPEESATGDAVESKGNEDGKSEEKSNDVTEKEGSSVNDGTAASTEVNEKTNSHDSSTEIPAEEAAQGGGGGISETENTNGGNKEESVKTEQGSNMETGEEGAAVQIQ